MRSAGKQGGFSLLEAIVALVVFASVGSALYAWIAVSLNGVARIEASRERDEAIQAGLAMIEHVNPMLKPQGQVEAGHYRVSWQSEVIEPPRDGLTPNGGASLYRVGLWRLQVAVEGGTEPIRFAIRKAGWQQARTPEFRQ
jgi:general secretion pathway protein I